jgi:hypothetical protein
MIAKDPQDGFYRLICSFRLPVCLRMVGRAHVLLDFELGTKFLEELRGEPHVSVRDNSFRNSVISSASGTERGEVFYGPTDWLGSRDPMTHI